MYMGGLAYIFHNLGNWDYEAKYLFPSINMEQRDGLKMLRIRHQIMT